MCSPPLHLPSFSRWLCLPAISDLTGFLIQKNPYLLEVKQPGTVISSLRSIDDALHSPLPRDTELKRTSPGRDYRSTAKSESQQLQWPRGNSHQFAPLRERGRDCTVVPTDVQKTVSVRGRQPATKTVSPAQEHQGVYRGP